MFVHGKAAFLMEMWSLDQAKTIETIRDDVLQSFQETDSLTQYCVVSIMNDSPSAVWSPTLEAALCTAPWWRVRRRAVGAMESIAQHEDAFEPLKEFLGRFIAGGIANESQIVRDEVIRCFARACSACRSGDLIGMMTAYSMPRSRAAIKDVRASLVRSSTEELRGAIASLRDWDWIGVTLESLYIQSGTKVPLPAYISQLIREELIAPPMNVSTPSSVYQELLAGMLSRETAQKRGLRFESLLNRLLTEVGCGVRGAYSIPGEQLDGMIEHRNIYYLVETKWTSAPVSVAPVSAFRGKVEGRIRGTCGVFVSVAGYTRNVVRTLERGKMQSVLLLDGDDVYYAFSQPDRFRELLDSKVRSAAGDGAMYSPVSLRSLLTAN